MKELTKNILVEYLDWCASLDSISLKTLSPFVLFISFWKNPKFIENSLLLIILIMINNFLTYNTLLIHFPNGEIINWYLVATRDYTRKYFQGLYF